MMSPEDGGNEANMDYWEPDFLRPSLQGREAAWSTTRKCLCMPTDPYSIVLPPLLEEIRDHNKLCDALVCCEDGTEFQISRYILASISPHFETLFTNKAITTATTPVPGHIFRKMLDYAYTAQCQIDINSFAPLMEYAKQYQVLGIMRLCAQFILDAMNPTNCIGLLFRYGRQYFCKRLNDRGLEYVHVHFPDIVRQSSELVDLSMEDITDLLSDDRLNVSSEMIVFETVKKWLLYDESRIQHLKPLFTSIRLGHLSKENLLDISKWPPIADHAEYQELIRSLRRSVYEPIRDYTNYMRDPHHRPRIPHNIPFVIGGYGSHRSASIVETYDIKAKRWFTCDQSCVMRAHHCVATLDGIIYVIGGVNGMEYYNTTVAFDPVTHTVRNRACMNFQRCKAAVVTLGGMIYVMGGFNAESTERLNSVERYDPVSNQWELVKPMLTKRSEASAACIHGKIYIVGGYSGEIILNSIEIYDPVKNSWSYGAAMPNRRTGLSVVQYDDKLYALGGCDGDSTLTKVEYLAPFIGNGVWTTVNSMIHGRTNFSAVVLDGRILAIGGRNELSTVNRAECYSIENDEWEIIPGMQCSRFGIGACVVSGLPNRLDYSFVGSLKRLGIVLNNP